ncbi:MAG TPA: FkbM family methyltransferase [Gemmatimonadaceae bacterium]
MRFKHLMKGLVSPFTARIRGGALQGRRWVIASGSRFVKGTYEPLQSAAFQRHIKAGDVVFDVGAHVGYYTVLSSVLTGPTGQVISFEPVPLNLRYLRRHVRMNGCDNVRIVEVCVGDRSSTARFDDSHGTGVGHLSADGGLVVRVRAIDEMVASGEVPVPQFIKVDVEGAELLVLQGADSILRKHHPAIILSTHGDDLERESRERLSRLGYGVELLEPGVLVGLRQVPATNNVRP